MKKTRKRNSTDDKRQRTDDAAHDCRTVAGYLATHDFDQYIHTQPLPRLNTVVNTHTHTNTNARTQVSNRWKECEGWRGGAENVVSKVRGGHDETDNNVIIRRRRRRLLFIFISCHPLPRPFQYKSCYLSKKHCVTNGKDLLFFHWSPLRTGSRHLLLPLQN